MDVRRLSRADLPALPELHRLLHVTDDPLSSPGLAEDFCRSSGFDPNGKRAFVAQAAPSTHCSALDMNQGE